MPRVLIVDDDTDFAEAARRVLQSDGHDVRVLTFVEKAMDALQADPPDCLVLDVMFPEDATAGFDLAREVRTRDELSRLPILILTAVNTRFPLGFGPKDIDNHWLPVQDFLEKPVDFDVLKEKVRRLCEEGKKEGRGYPREAL
jgi:DNA-binding response OmpR family regulator